MARLGIRTTLFDRSYQAVPAGSTGGPEKGEAGASTDSWYTDIQGGGPDVNPELSGSAKFAVFEEMALVDPTIRSLLMFYALPVRSAIWGLDPRSPDSVSEPDAVARAICDFCAWNLGLEDHLGEMDLSWGASVGFDVTTGLKHGPSIRELIYDTDGRVWTDADGDTHTVWPLARLAPRPARTIERVKREKGRITEITQNVPGTKPMKAEKVSYVVFDPDETGRWEGSSMIRPAWVAWRMKKALQLAAGIGWDRFASGIPIIYHPADDESERRAKAIGRSIRNHERAYVNLPAAGESSAAGRPASEWFVDLLNGTNTLADPVPLLRYFTEQETEAGLAHFSRLGTTENGSRAVAETQIDPFYLAVQAIAQELRRERERQVLRQLVAVNFGTEAAERYTPKLTVSRIQARNVEVVARAISYLSPAGFTFTDLGAQNDVREMLGFAKLDEAAEISGISRAQLLAAFQTVGLDAETVAELVNALPPELGVARNRVPAEGAGLTS